MIELSDEEGGKPLGQDKRLLLVRILPKLPGPSQQSEFQSGLGSLHLLSTSALEGKSCER
jgi:hypothetical protein